MHKYVSMYTHMHFLYRYVLCHSYKERNKDDADLDVCVHIQTYICPYYYYYKMGLIFGGGRGYWCVKKDGQANSSSGGLPIKTQHQFDF